MANTLIDLYCRKSKAVKSKNRRQEISITAQEAMGRRVAEQLGLTVRHVWREVGSASHFSKSESRDKQTKALDALEKGEVSALWCYKIDRWDRRGAGAILRIIEPDDGLPRRLLIGWDENIQRPLLDSTNPRDRGELIRRAEDAREETDRLSERVRDAFAHQRENGEWTNRRPPYGYRITRITDEDEDDEECLYELKKLEQDDTPAAPGSHLTKADVARFVITAPVEHQMTAPAICTYLNERGIPSPSGTKWYPSTVYAMIRHPTYAGWQITKTKTGRRLPYYNSAGQRVRVTAGPPIATDEEMEAASAAIGGTSRGPGYGRRKHLLTGHVRCATCGASCTASFRSYRCWRDAQCSSPTRVTIARLDAYVLACLKAKLQASEPDDEFLVKVAARWAERTHPLETESARAARAALREAEATLERLLKDRQKGVYDGPAEQFFYPAHREALRAIEQAKDTLAASEAASAVDVTWLLDPADYEDWWERASQEDRFALIDCCVDEVWVTRGQQGRPFNGYDRVTIKWVGEE